MRRSSTDDHQGSKGTVIDVHKTGRFMLVRTGSGVWRKQAELWSCSIYVRAGASIEQIGRWRVQRWWEARAYRNAQQRRRAVRFSLFLLRHCAKDADCLRPVL